MVDIEKKAVSKEEFNALITTILNIDTGELNVRTNVYLCLYTVCILVRIFIPGGFFHRSTGFKQWISSRRVGHSWPSNVWI